MRPGAKGANKGAKPLKFEPPLQTEGRTIGHFACSAGGGRLVRVGVVGEGKPPRLATVICPVCDNEHVVAVTWRKPTEIEPEREPEIVVEATSPEPAKR